MTPFDELIRQTFNAGVAYAEGLPGSGTLEDWRAKLSGLDLSDDA